MKIITHKSKAGAALLCFFVGALGIHRFYLGGVANNWAGGAYLFMTIACAALSPAIAPLIGFVLIVETIFLICQPKAYYRRDVEVEVVA